MTHDIDHLVSQLTIEEKAQLTSGASMWTTHGIDRCGVPSVTVTDGPAGARGPTLPGIGAQVPTLCIPCGSALGATFDPHLLEQLGEALGHQARTKGARVLLAPTVNLPRSPLFGRSFECYSEDPILSGKLAAAFVRGAQSQGVATTVKHFVGNETEFERMTIDTVIDERTLREVYLVPFELAVREGGSLGIMTSYNRVNGSYCAESRWLLQDILREEWGFDGFVVTDWFAGATTRAAAVAGLDLEMPGPARAYGRFLAQAVAEGEVDEADLDRAVSTLLSVFSRLGAFDDEPVPSTAVDLPAHRALARRAASESMVLLKNESRAPQSRPLLPLDATSLRSVALIGPNAERTRIMGGGSAEVRPTPPSSSPTMGRPVSGSRSSTAPIRARICSPPSNDPMDGCYWPDDTTWVFPRPASISSPMASCRCPRAVTTRCRWSRSVRVDCRSMDNSSSMERVPFPNAARPSSEWAASR